MKQRMKYYIILIFSLLLIVSCSSNEQIIQEDLKKDFVAVNVQSSSDLLNKAILERKILREVIPLDGNEWTSIFTDNSSIVFPLLHTDTENCYLTIGNDSCWYISDDHGASYTPFYNSENKKIIAINNVSGKEIIRDDVIINSNCCRNSIIQAIVEDNFNHTLSIKLNNGEIFDFPKSDIVFYDFSIISSDNPNIVHKDLIYCIGTNKLVVITPYYFDKTKLIARFTVTPQNKVYVGQEEQISGESINNFTEEVNYRIKSPFGENNFKIRIQNTGLPIIIINTPGAKQIDSKTEWISNTEIKIILPDGTIDYEDKQLQIRGRGNSTWGFPKKPFALKLSKKSKILDMPKHKRWILLANWLDRTLLRNEFSFEISRNTDLAWTPRGKFVEVILNGKHIGNYYICEQIKVDKNRVNIREMLNTDIEDSTKTGGYLVELDRNYDEKFKFRSVYKNFPYMFKEPDDEVLQLEQFEYFKNYINTLETLLYSNNWLENREYSQYMDLYSFADWRIVNELTMNWEPNHPKSTYLYKDVKGKLTAGPVWDFDWKTFTLPELSLLLSKKQITMIDSF